MGNGLAYYLLLPDVPWEAEPCCFPAFLLCPLGTGNLVFKGLQLLRNWGPSLSQAELILRSLEIREQGSLGTQGGSGGLPGRKQRVPGLGGCSGNPLHGASSSLSCLEAEAAINPWMGLVPAWATLQKDFFSRPHLHKIMKSQ